MYSDTEHTNISSDTSKKERGMATLLLLFVWVMVKKLLKKMLRWLLLFILLLIRFCKYLISWWTDGDTKQKRIDLWRKVKRGFGIAGKLILVGAVLLWRGLIWLLKSIFLGLIHLRTTLKKGWQWTRSAMTKLKQTDFRALAREQKKTLTKLVAEDSDEKTHETEEELLKELEKNAKKGAMERWIEQKAGDLM